MKTDDCMNKGFLVLEISRQDILNLYQSNQEHYEAIEEMIKDLSEGVMEHIARVFGRAIECEHFLQILDGVCKDIVQPDRLYQYYEHKLEKQKERKEKQSDTKL